MKKYAYYLPQFHEIPENDLWWGKGFTEWVNVKKAQSLVLHHQQPKVPLNNNYYTLDNPDTLRWQAKIAKDFNIDGMIFYHYWFCGKKLLYKPAEILLNNKIDMDFFFCWANHSWYRSWEDSKALLIEQTYGNETDWEAHFQYLLNFFKDRRYVKRNNKPLFMLFIPDFEKKEPIISYFNRRCCEVGFDGLEVIESIQNYGVKDNQNKSALVHTREPNCSSMQYKYSKSNIFFRIKNKMLKELNKITGYKYLETFCGDDLLNIAISHYNPKRIPGLCFEWDNTPRHGFRGYIITPPSKELFMKYMDTISDSEFVFINAWNEWCEGMILEPTEENGYKYLSWIKEWSEKHENRIDGI